MNVVEAERSHDEELQDLQRPPRPEKIAEVERLEGVLKDSASVFLTDFRGIDVAMMNDLRGRFREADVQFKIVKNNLLIRAADNADLLDWVNDLEGPTAMATSLLDPVGRSIGLDGVILLAYVIAIPANEIIVPVILMAYTGAVQMIDIAGRAELEALLIGEQGWTLLTAVCLMLFSLLHNPCSTTIYTIWKETGSRKWTIVGALMPLAIAFAVCFLVANVWRLIAGI